MPRHLILFILSFFISTFTFGQKIGDYFVSISIDSTQGGRLKFISDTTIELSTVPRHMSPSFSSVFKYIAKDSTIEIIPNSNKASDTLTTGLRKKGFALEKILILTVINGCYIDYEKSLIYIRQKDFGNNPDLTYIIDGKTYIQDIGVTDGYGLIKKMPKENKYLQKKLNSLKKDKFTIEMFRGLNAYKRFGIKKVYGVIFITSKK
jgi:hypothetical protein